MLQKTTDYLAFKKFALSRLFSCFGHSLGLGLEGAVLDLEALPLNTLYIPGRCSNGQIS